MVFERFRLCEICDLIPGFAFKSKDFGDFDERVIKIANIVPPSIKGPFVGFDGSKYDTNKLKKFIVNSGDYVLAMTGATIGKIGLVKQNGLYINQRVLKFSPRDSIVDRKFLYYCLVDNKFSRFIENNIDSNTAQPNISGNSIGRFEILLPCRREQERIANFLHDFDKKIEINDMIIRNLNEQLDTIFSNLIDKNLGSSCSWRQAPLTSIAIFLNGLAMQKFPPMTEEECLPVLKIKELRQGFCDDKSDRCASDIDEKYIVKDGDVIFSWSGTLVVDVWTGGCCGLNQHLFNVKSEKFPKWFYYLWVKRHLKWFSRIAAGKATTMGHIKRSDLENALVLIPSDAEIRELSKIFTPLLDLLINLKIENRKLILIRDGLLPRLLSGEIELKS